ncbi:7450_t:CDS:2, partial [Entrophospora sp. SA101]
DYSESKEPKDLLEIAKNIKEIGNSYYKKSEYENKWNLEAKLIPLKSFDFNFEKYTVDIPMETVVEDEIGGKDHIRSLQSIFLIEINNKKQSKNNKK